jgi:hypothetical protein
VIEVLVRYIWTWAMVCDSIVGQSFFGLECNDARNELPVGTTGAIRGRITCTDSNKIHELRVIPILSITNQ